MNSLTGSTVLIGLSIRRSRLMLAAWIIGLGSLIAGTAASIANIFPTAASRLDFATGLAHNSTALALFGPIFDATSVGGLTAWRINVMGSVFVSLMSIMLVIRHTRTEEESGRLELLSAAVVGRYASITAGILTSAVASLAVGALTSLSLLGLGESANGSIAFGLSLVAVGWLFSGIAAVTAQLTESARTARGIAIAVLGMSYVLRAVGDLTDDQGFSWLSWLSPIGWAELVRPFAAEQWWTFALFGVFTIVLCGLSYLLRQHRDLGSGLIPAKLGPSAGAPGLRNSVALAWRLQKGSFIGWCAGFVIYGFVIGGVAQGVVDLVNGSPQTKEILTKIGGEKGIVDAFLSTVMAIFGLIAASYAIQAASRLRSEETGLRAESILATSVSRTRWLASHYAFVALGPTILLIGTGFSAGLVHGLANGDVSTQLPRVLAAALIQLPAVWVIGGIAIALFGCKPQFIGAAWGALAIALVLGQLGELLRLNRWLMDVSPFSHLPQLPGGQVAVVPIVMLIAVAIGLTTVGVIGFRRRDIG